MSEYGNWRQIKEPNISDGGGSAHSDFFMHPIPEGIYSPNEWGPEFDVGERPTWERSGNDNTKISFWVHGDVDTGTYVGDCCGDDLSQDFHTYGMWWNNDGSGTYGSFQMYLDGTSVFSSPVVIEPDNTNMGNGMYMFLSLDDDSNSPNDPYIIQYVRVWRLDPN